MEAKQHDLTNQQIMEDIKNEIKICRETKENENMTTPNLWDSVKAVLRGRSIGFQTYFKKQEKNQINNLTLHLKQLEKEEMKNPRVSRRKEIIKIKAEINEKETKVTIAKISKTKSCFCCCCSIQFCFIFSPIIFISWRLITLQYCSGFCHTLT